MANLDRLARIAVDLGGHGQGPEALASTSVSIAALLASGDRVFIETPIGPIDIVQGLTGVPPYSELQEPAIEASILDVSVQVCSLEDLRSMKRAAGRTRDLADLEDLETGHGQPDI